MTDKQLFEAFGGVREKYLSEMLDDEPQRAIELRPVKRSPFKKTAMAVTACAAAVGIAFGGLAVSGKIDLPVLFGGSRGIVQGDYAVSKSCSVSLENIVLDDDWPEKYPNDFLKDLFSEYDCLDELPSDLSEYVGRDTDYEYTPVTADLKLSFSNWIGLPNEQVMAHVRFFADGEPIKYLPFKDPYYYHPDYETKYKEDEFDPITQTYDVAGHFTLDKARADNADDESKEKFYEFPVTFDVKKGTSQITVMVEFSPYGCRKDDAFYLNGGWDLYYDEVITQTFPIGAMTGSEDHSGSPGKIKVFNTNGLGWFETEKKSGKNSEQLSMIISDDRTLKINTSELSIGKVPYYLMVLMDSEPIACFDGKVSKLIDPADPDNETLIGIPEEFAIPDGMKRELWLIAIPVIGDEKYSDGVYAAPVSNRHLLWVTKTYDYHSEFDSKDNVMDFYDARDEAEYALYSDKKVYTTGEKIKITMKVKNVSDKPLELYRYVTTDPADSEPVISPFTIKMTQRLSYGYSYSLGGKNRDAQNLILEPGESYYREAVIDTSKLPNGTGVYEIVMHR